MNINQRLFTYIHNFSGQNPIFDGIGIFLANYLVYFLVLGFLFLIIIQDGPRRRFYLFAEGALATILSRGIVAEIIRFFYYHPRPFDFYGFSPLIAESGASFPSGHMTFLFALATVIWYADKKWGIFYFLLSLVIGVARIYVGVHWPYDIAGGIVIGIICAVIIHLILRKSRKAIYAKPVEQVS